jgi:glucose-1-phosphate thymidylyltransferase
LRTLVLGDNALYGHGLSATLHQAFRPRPGATIFAYRVADPERYGVVEFDREDRAISIEEKPQQPKSDWAAIGLYVFDNEVTGIAKSLRPSARGELEIAGVIEAYLKAGKLRVEKLGRGYAWFDTGTPDSLLDAAQFVATIERRQGIKISSPDEIAFQRGFISADEFERLISERYPKNDYGRYLRSVLRTHVARTPA